MKLDVNKLIDEGAWVTKTPNEDGRFHIYLIAKNDVNVGREVSHGVELRGNGHYVLFYPSIHPNGKQYDFLNTKDASKLAKPKIADVEMLWEKWKEHFASVFTSDKDVEKHVKSRKEFDRSPYCIHDAWEKGADTGERKMTIIGLSNWLREHSFPISMSENIVLDWFKTKCDGKGMRVSEVMEAVKAGYEEKYSYGCRFWRNNTSFCPYKMKTECSWYQPDIKSKHELLDKYDAIIYDKKGKPLKVIPYNFARMLSQEHDYNFTVIRDATSNKEEIFYYEDGYYKRNGILKIRQLINYYLEGMSSEHYKREICGCMSDFNNKSRDALEPPLHLINMKNGIYNINTGELIPHSQDYYFINQIPIEYNPKAKCDNFLRFLEDVVYPPHIPTIQEMIGFCFYRKYFLNVAFLLVGGGRNGKGVLVNVIENLVGRCNVSTEPLEDLTTRPYSSAQLYGKLVNIGSEISDSELKNANKFKIVTGNEPMKGEIKYGATFTFKNYAKLIFNTNQVPYSHDHSFAFKQRWIIIPFPQTFPRGEPTTNPRLDEELTTQQELQGVFNWAMEGLRRILKNYDFTYDNTNTYEDMINPDKTFINAFLELDYGNFISNDELYEKYVDYCKKHLFHISTRSIFFDKVKYYLPEITKCRKRIDGEREYGFENIGWKK